MGNSSFSGTIPFGEERLEDLCHRLMPKTAAFNIEARRNVTFCDKPGTITGGHAIKLELE
jgi:hypothetical protein